MVENNKVPDCFDKVYWGVSYGVKDRSDYFVSKRRIRGPGYKILESLGVTHKSNKVFKMRIKKFNQKRKGNRTKFDMRIKVRAFGKDAEIVDCYEADNVLFYRVKWAVTPKPSSYDRDIDRTPSNFEWLQARFLKEVEDESQ